MILLKRIATDEPARNRLASLSHVCNATCLFADSDVEQLQAVFAKRLADEL